MVDHRLQLIALRDEMLRGDADETHPYIKALDHAIATPPAAAGDARDAATDQQITNALDAEYGTESRLHEFVGGDDADHSTEHKVRVVRALLAALTQEQTNG